MNRTIKDATVKRYFYETHNQLRAHLQNFLDAYNFARRLKTLKGLTPTLLLCPVCGSHHGRRVRPALASPSVQPAQAI